MGYKVGYKARYKIIFIIYRQTYRLDSAEFRHLDPSPNTAARASSGGPAARRHLRDCGTAAGVPSGKSRNGIDKALVLLLKKRNLINDYNPRLPKGIKKR